MDQNYYDHRAREYEEIYHREDPVRRGELADIASAMRTLLSGCRVLEVACGTGYWTEVAAEVAQHVVAVDISADMLAVARSKGLPAEKVEFRQADSYMLGRVPGGFNAGLANFWFSHVPKARMNEFLDGFHRRLGSNAVVFMADNVYAWGIGGELIVRPGAEDTFKLRRLSDGSEHEILKNYYDEDELSSILSPRAKHLQIKVGQCFWWATYSVI